MIARYGLPMPESAQLSRVVYPASRDGAGPHPAQDRVVGNRMGASPIPTIVKRARILSMEESVLMYRSGSGSVPVTRALLS